MANLNRRDFLRLITTTLPPLALTNLLAQKRDEKKTNRPNIIFIVFDAMSAYHLSIYGYRRKTTPYMEQFAKQSNLYHAHYSAANFTVPGTSSMLTGLYPWTHRAMHHAGLVKRSFTDRNIFNVLGQDYYRIGFGQNVWAGNLLNQFRTDIEELLPTSSFSDFSMLMGEYFPNDPNNAHEFMNDFSFVYPSSPGTLTFGIIQRLLFERKKQSFIESNLSDAIRPRNYPFLYTLSKVFDGLADLFNHAPNSFFSYIHIFSPHAPYKPTKYFQNMFKDDWEQPEKKESFFSQGETQESLKTKRLKYDQYIANVDHELGRLLDHLKSTGVFDNSYIIITSDHGELLERGVYGHSTPLLYEPLVRVPLIIHSPGQTTGENIYTPTSSVDLLPTLANLAGQQVPAWAEGKLLPKLGGSLDTERKIYMLEAKSSSAFGPLTKFTLAMRMGNYKIILYRGYPNFNGDFYELYNLAKDPEELDDLIDKETEITTAMKNELINKVNQIS